MHIIPIQFEKSLPVSNWQAIVEDATEMARIIDERDIRYEDGRFYTGNALALHHMQVNEKPFNFFVVTSLIGEQILNELGSRFIVNPKIDILMAESVSRVEEGCVSFPYKKAIKKERAYVCGVTYQVPDAGEKGGLRTVQKQVAGLVAQMFQHECDHANGVNLYYKSPKGE